MLKNQKLGQDWAHIPKNSTVLVLSLTSSLRWAGPGRAVSTGPRLHVASALIHLSGLPDTSRHLCFYHHFKIYLIKLSCKLFQKRETMEAEEEIPLSISVKRRSMKSPGHYFVQE